MTNHSDQIDCRDGGRFLAAYMMDNRARITPLWPAAFISQEDAFAAEDFVFVDIGKDNGAWRRGGTMWFTRTR